MEDFLGINRYIIIGLSLLLISFIIYLTNSGLDGYLVTVNFMLHLFWSMLTALSGIGLILVGILKQNDHNDQ